MKDRRSRFEMMLDVLAVIRAREPECRITYVMYGLGSAYTATKELLTKLTLLQLIFVEKRQGKNLYHISERGTRMLNEYRDLRENLLAPKEEILA